MAGTLYIVATPIGNLADISLRALSTLREVDCIAAEDTRTTHNLLQHYGIDTPATPYHQHSLARKAEKLLQSLQSGEDIAIVSDAGTPGISDPGHELITMAIANDIPVVAIPGANAIITALVVSGLPTRRFTFEGFPPRRSSERRTYFKDMVSEMRTMVFYESPHRILATLKDMKTAWGDRPVAVVREATKKFEEIHRGTITSAIDRFTEVSPRGEFTLVVGGLASAEEPAELSTDVIDDALCELLADGISERDAVRQVSETYSIPRREIYRRMIDLKKEQAAEEPEVQ
jgi:16S rRNA (cytidine1402-2'-O)-methyltransferase